MSESTKAGRTAAEECDATKEGKVRPKRSAKRLTPALKGRIAAGLLVAISLTYWGAAAGSGHSASSSPPADASATALGLNVWQASAQLLAAQGNRLLVDTREPSEFALYHLPGAVNLPGISPQALRARAAGKKLVLVVASLDSSAQNLVGAAQPSEGATGWHYLSNGVRDWYLTFELPVPLFSEKPPPFGYAEALRQLERAIWQMRSQSEGERALAKLQSLEYAPSLLQGKKVKKSSGKRKKISGGCGG